MHERFFQYFQHPDRNELVDGKPLTSLPLEISKCLIGLHNLSLHSFTSFSSSTYWWAFPKIWILINNFKAHRQRNPMKPRQTPGHPDNSTQCRTILITNPDVGNAANPILLET